MKFLVLLFVSILSFSTFAKDVVCHIRIINSGTGQTSQDLGLKSLVVDDQGAEVFKNNNMTYKVFYYFSQSEGENLFTITSSEFGLFLEGAAQSSGKNVRLVDLKNEVSLNCTLKD